MEGEHAQHKTEKALAQLDCDRQLGSRRTPTQTSLLTTATSRSCTPSPGSSSTACQQEAAKRALALNMQLQEALREELGGVEDALAENREVLKEAEQRLASMRSVGITTSSDKFLWSRAVDKFLAVGAHPGPLGSRKEQEMLLRTEPIGWSHEDRQVLWNEVAKVHPPAVDAATAVDALADIDWNAVAAAMEKTPRSHKSKTRSGRVRTAEECWVRWANYDMPGSADAEVWSKTEDMIIMEQATTRRGRDWVEVAKMVNECEEDSDGDGGGDGGGGRDGKRKRKRRTPVACLRRFQGALNNDLVRWHKWTDREDALLLNAVRRYGDKEFLTISRALADRTPGQCFNRWTNMKTSTFAMTHQVVDGVRDTDAPERVPHRGGAWTPTEERRLCLAVRAMTPQKEAAAVAASAAATPAADAGAAKTGISARRGRRTDTTALEEPRRLRPVGDSNDALVDIAWPEVAKLMANLRNEHQCRGKWFESLDPAVNRSLWTDEEDRELLRVTDAGRLGEWRSIEKDMAVWARKRGVKRRTDQQCRRRYSHMEPDKYEEYIANDKKRRAVETRVHGTKRSCGGRTKITIEDYDSSELEGGEEDEEEEEEEEQGGKGREERGVNKNGAKDKEQEEEDDYGEDDVIGDDVYFY